MHVNHTAPRPLPLDDWASRADDAADYLAQLAVDTNYRVLANVATKVFLLADELKAAATGRVR
jgi:hypothetical protein